MIGMGGKQNIKAMALFFVKNVNSNLAVNYFYCIRCYNKETNEEERNRMKFGRCKRCFESCTRYNWCPSCNDSYFNKRIAFKTSDYDLNREEGIIFCGECEQIFDSSSFYCKHWYNTEINEKERNHMLYGRCKGCSQACTDNNWCSSCGIQNNSDFNKQIVFKTSDYDLNMNERKVK